MSSSRSPSLRKRKQVVNYDNDDDDDIDDEELPHDDNNSDVATKKFNKKSKVSISSKASSSSKASKEEDTIASILISKAARLDLETLIKSQITSASIIKLLGKGSDVDLARNVATGRKVGVECIRLADSDLGYFSPFDSDVLISILTNLSTTERLMMVTTVSKGFNNLCSNPQLWPSMAIGDDFGGGRFDRALKIDAGGLKKLADKIVSQKINVSQVHTLQICCVKSKNSISVTNYKSFLKATGSFFEKNVRILKIFGKLSGSEAFLQHLPFSGIQEMTLLRDEVCDTTMFHIFKNAPELISFTGTAKSLSAAFLTAISNGHKTARNGGNSVLQKLHISPLYDFYTSSLSFEFFFFNAPELFPELSDVDLSISWFDVRTPSHARSIEANPDLWRNYRTFDPFGQAIGSVQYKTSISSQTGTRIDYNRYRFENGTRVAHVEKGIKNGVFSRMIYLKLKLSWETAQILQDEVVEIMHTVLDERSEFIFKTIGTSCPQLESLEITCKEFRVPYMNSKEKRSRPVPYLCPFPHCNGIEALPATLIRLKLTNFRVKYEHFGLFQTNNLNSITLVNCGDDSDTAAVKSYLVGKCNEKCKIEVEKKNRNACYF